MALLFCFIIIFNRANWTFSIFSAPKPTELIQFSLIGLSQILPPFFCFNENYFYFSFYINVKFSYSNLDYEHRLDFVASGCLRFSGWYLEQDNLHNNCDCILLQNNFQNFGKWNIRQELWAFDFLLF